MNDYAMTHCDYCGCEGCSPTCPGPTDVGTCPRCGASTGNGRCSDPDMCGYGWEPRRVEMYPSAF